MKNQERAMLQAAFDQLFAVALTITGPELTEYVAAVRPLRDYLDSQGLR